jgi:hypothetical protein
MAITAGGSLNSVAAPLKATLSSNYINFADGSTGWEQQYLPDLMEKEAEVFGNRTISGFLSQVGAEEAMSGDSVIWSEQGRLHLAYTATMTTASAGTIVIVNDIDGNTAGANHGIRDGDTVLLSKSTFTVPCYVTGVSGSTVTLFSYYSALLTDAASGSFVDGDDTLRVLVYGSEWGKGTNGQTTANEPQFKSFRNKPVIIKDFYQVSGSDASQIGWVEVSGESGESGYLWYLKAEGETRSRFSDYCEMAVIEGALTATASTVEDELGMVANTSSIGEAGTEGLFEAIKLRGNQSSGITGVNAATDLAEFDAILAEFDKQGSIEENMMFVNRATSLAMDDMLASMNSYGAGGTSYGVFDNSEDMALNLGFSGFRRGSYDFYKSDWKYLNDQGTRGALNDTVTNIRGVMIPAGVSTVYDQSLGKNLKRPFLHVRYRASATESRKMKTWTTGSVGAVTSDLDAMNVHFLSERCLITQGANNFMLLS